MSSPRIPPCSLHEACGGCSAMIWDEAEQLRRKVEKVGRILQLPIDRVHPSPRALGYRARISLHTGPAGALGYHRPRSHTWVRIPACALARPELATVLDRLPPLPGLARIELRTGGQGVVLSAQAQRKKKRGRRGRSGRPVLEALDLDALGLQGIALDGRTLRGSTEIGLQVGEITHQLGPSTFYQVNLEVNAALVSAVSAVMAARSPSGILDLYGGCGNLSFPSALAGVRVVLIESSGPAVSDARRTVARHQLPVEIRRQDAGRFRAGEAFFDLALLDPPRAGAPGVIPELLFTRPRAIVLVSCNPATLARDIRPALASGYQARQIEVFDMFPQTPHVEVLCVLDRT